MVTVTMSGLKSEENGSIHIEFPICLSRTLLTSLPLSPTSNKPHAPNTPQPQQLHHSSTEFRHLLLYSLCTDTGYHPFSGKSS